MEFRTYAAREATAVVAHVVETVSEKSLNDLQSLRHAIEMVAGAVDTVLEAQETPQYHEEVHALADRLTSEAEALGQAARDEAHREAEVVINELRQALEARTNEHAETTKALAHARTELDRLHSQLEAQSLELESRTAAFASEKDAARILTAERDDLSARLHSSREELTALAHERDDLSARLQESAHQLTVAALERDAVATQIEGRAAEMAGLVEERNHLAGQVDTLAAQLEAATATGAQSERDRQAIAAKLEAESNAVIALRQRLATLERELTELRIDANVTRTLRDRLEAADRENARLQAQLAAAGETAGATVASQAARPDGVNQSAEQAAQVRRDASAFLSTSFDRVAAMYSGLASGGSVDGILAALVEAMAVQFPRVALFRVQGKHLEGVRQAGFDLREDISQLLIPRSLDGLITNAVTSGRIETRSAEELADTIEAPFGGSPEFALALPLVIDGQPLAVVYADDAGQQQAAFTGPEVRMKYAHLLQCQAIPLLAGLTAEASALTELDEYSALLLEQLEQTYQSDTENQAPGAEAARRERLRDNVEYARQLYAQRAASQGPRAATFFEQRLLSAIEGMRSTVFGRDLAALAGVEVSSAPTKAANGPN